MLEPSGAWLHFGATVLGMCMLELSGECVSPRYVFMLELSGECVSPRYVFMLELSGVCMSPRMCVCWSCLGRGCISEPPCLLGMCMLELSGVCMSPRYVYDGAV